MSEAVVEPVPSPCNSVCTMDAATGWCKGCRRSIDEIVRWAGMSDAQKRVVWDALPARDIRT